MAVIDSSRDKTSSIGSTPKPRKEGGDPVEKVNSPWNVRMANGLKGTSPELLGKTKHRTGKI
jgi:hypothetical protein